MSIGPTHRKNWPLVLVVGFEPTRMKYSMDFKSIASAYYATPTNIGDSDGIRTHVTAVKEQCLRPLDHRVIFYILYFAQVSLSIILHNCFILCCLICGKTSNCCPEFLWNESTAKTTLLYCKKIEQKIFINKDNKNRQKVYYTENIFSAIYFKQ